MEYLGERFADTLPPCGSDYGDWCHRAPYEALDTSIKMQAWCLKYIVKFGMSYFKKLHRHFVRAEAYWCNLTK